MGDILSVFVQGLSTGTVYFLLAAGLTLTMGLMRIVNLAHGALYMMGGYIGLAVAGRTHNYWAGILVAAACVGLIGLVLETAFLRRLYGQATSQVLLTIGFIYILRDVATWIWGSLPFAQRVPGVFSGSVQVGNVKLEVFRLVVIAFGLLMAAGLWLLQDKTRIGAVVRAGMDNREIAGALGINLKGVFTGIFVLGAFIAGFCGLIGSTVAVKIDVNAAWDALLLSMIVVVVGGTGSIQGALVGGVLLGLLEAFGKAYFPDYSHFIAYVTLIVVLLIRPGGLLGRQMATGPTASQYLEAQKRRKRPWANNARARISTGLSHLSAPLAQRRRNKEAAVQAAAIETPRWLAVLGRWFPYLFIVLVLGLVPSFVGTYDQSILTKVVIFMLFAMSLDLTMGYTGMVSFGHAAFLGVAGYAFGLFTAKVGISSFWLAALIALSLTVVAALVIAFISLRVTDTYYLLVTMGLGQVLSVIALKWDSVTNGTDGLTNIVRPDLGFGVDWTSAWSNLRYYYFALVLFVICYVILRRVVGSSFGRTLVGIRLNEQRMRSLGFNTWKMKYVAIVIGGLFAGLAGILYACSYGSMFPKDVALQMSSLPMLMVILGGRSTLWGPCLGAAVIIYAREKISAWGPVKDKWWFILGVVFVVCVMFLPGGFAPHLIRFWNWIISLLSRLFGGRSGSIRADAAEEVTS
jgi:branched-chain amino acid transport system permease protein